MSFYPRAVFVIYDNELSSNSTLRPCAIAMA